METQAKTPEPIERAIGRICASQAFVRADRAARLLRYVVEKTLHGQAGEVKEYTIALEVFGRASYDSRIDSLVRVEAGKLRELLAKYYETEGRDDPVRIEIPKGGYVPVFHEASLAPPAPRRLRLVLAAGVLVLLVAGAALWRWGRPRRVPGRSSAPASIAVLPFVDMSLAKDQEYFADGLTEELITALAGLEGLRVASHTSVSGYKGKPQDVRRIGEELKVQAVLEGSVRVEGGRIRVAAQLINTSDGFHLWTETFDRDFQDVFEIQRQISSAVVKSIVYELPGTRRALIRPRTQNAEAWHYYLRAARLAGASPSVAEMLKSIEFYKAAVAADPGYALAWAGLARTWSVLTEWEEVRPAEVLPQAAGAARKAVEMDRHLSEAHHALARVQVFYERDFAGAERSFRRAIELDPADTEPRLDYARFVLNPNGRFGEAANELQRAIALDSTKVTLYNELANTHIKARQYDRAFEPLEISRKLLPRAPSVYTYLGIASFGKGDSAEALRWFGEAAAIRRSGWLLGHLGFTYARLGRREEAEKIIEELRGMSGRRVSDFEIGVIRAGLGDKESALTALGRAFDAWAGAMPWLKVDYRLDDLHGEPRFQALVKKMRL